MLKSTWKATQSTNLVKRDLGGLLHLTRISVESTVRLMGLLLDCSTKLQEILGNRLVGTLEDIDQTTSETLLVIGEESDGPAILACATSSANAVDVVLDTVIS